MVDPIEDISLEEKEELPSNCATRLLQVECTKLYDDTVHRHYLRIDKDKEISVKFLRNLLERELNIPIICQVRLSVNGIPLDPLPQDFGNFPKRFLKDDQPILVSLDYYVATANLFPIRIALEGFYCALSADLDYELISNSLDALAHSCFNVSWDSDEAVGYRLYLNSVGFIAKLLQLIQTLNSILKKNYEHAKDISIVDDNVHFKWIEDILLSFQTLLKALRSLMLFSARWEDKMLMCELKLPAIIQETFAIAKLYLTPNDVTLGQIGDTITYYCSIELQLLLSVRPVSVLFGLDKQFIELLKDCLVSKRGLSREQESDSICLFNLSGTACVSRLLYSSGIYAEIIQHYLHQNTFRLGDTIKYEQYYRVALVTLHMLKTPNLSLTSARIVEDASSLLNIFLSTLKAEDIASIEQGGFCFGTLENYFSILFIPTNSILGEIIANSESKEKYKSLIHNCYKMGVFTMEVLMLLEAGRRVILSENLLPHLVIADWTVGNLASKIKLHFPSVTHLPVPSLYDIAALKAVSIGIGDYKQMMHYKI